MSWNSGAVGKIGNLFNPALCIGIALTPIGEAGAFPTDCASAPTFETVLMPPGLNFAFRVNDGPYEGRCLGRLAGSGGSPVSIAFCDAGATTQKWYYAAKAAISSTSPGGPSCYCINSSAV